MSKARQTDQPILVLGGAGYIGSHMVKMLGRAGYRPVVVDDLSSGHADAVGDARLITGNFGDSEFIDQTIKAIQPVAVMHFASFIQVGESTRDPAKYYQNNFNATHTLLEAMRVNNIDKFIFSSTAAIFGNPVEIPINEAHPKQPINPYGRTKLFVEQMLEDYDAAYNLKSICLRYFNAAGADPEGQLGERHDPETHLIPLVLRAAAGRIPHITVFGTDYDTPDGTCIRDYIHVHDLCSAHLLALEKLLAGCGSARYNLGNGNGFSVKQVIDVVQQVTELSVPVKYGDRREGDPASLVADAMAARQELSWQPRYPALKDIVQHAWAWESSRALSV
ncbi:UDP-glucose 4-epimerase GalE [Bordetella petrii]|nr:UDP-glucose 4-epimerase GalE [Bordetella petrii]